MHLLFHSSDIAVYSFSHKMDLIRKSKDGFSPIFPTACKGRGRKKPFLYIVQHRVALSVPRNHPEKNYVVFIIGKMMVNNDPKFLAQKENGLQK